MVAINFTRNRRDPDGYIRRNYSAADVDAIGAYCGELDCCYLIPIELVAGRWTIQLRLCPARNGQRAALHFADEYRLGAVAQLEERRRGTAEATGSSPVSSTSENEDVAVEEVGAHQFRNHFGYYMECAAAGANVLIRRRGRPFARLGPANLRISPEPAD